MSTNRQAAMFPAEQWVATEPDADVDLATLSTQVARITSSHDALGVTNALVFVHRGRVVSEWYADGGDETTTHISWSMAKSITHALVGIASADGLLQVAAPAAVEQWKSDERRAITMQDLLEMRSGLSWVEDYVDGEASDVIDMLFGSGTHDHASHAASKPLAHPPGSQWLYSSGTTNIVTRLLGDALGDGVGSHDRIENFMREKLFDRIGMSSATPKFDDRGTFVGSSYVYATARDFARFGHLYLHDGVWNGHKVLPDGWVDHARRTIARDPENGFGYGAHWWTWPSERRSLVALGYEGQYTWVVPGRDLVVVRLGKSDASKREALTMHLLSAIGAFPLVEG